ncbi:MAG: hypothetical protein EXX96DRAFT_285752 [Benjaminiella poitrasii]|nr:MAG: hypothetical protein EXX96DRAFT_285752 [Benjaminiella poitrasii]
MFHSNQRKNDSNSILSNDLSTLKSVWHRVSQLFYSKSSCSSDCTLGDNNSSLSGSSSSRRRSNRRYSSLSTESNASSSLSKGYAFSSSDISSNRYNNKTNRKRKLVTDSHSLSDPPPQSLVIPPFSPTYCRPNEFPYSNFYVRLPNGKWMIRYRSGNRDILGTDEFEGYMI